MDPAHETKMDERRKNTDLEILYKKTKNWKVSQGKTTEMGWGVRLVMFSKLMETLFLMH